MGNTWVTRMIDTNQYSQFVCDEYIIEVIPDISKHEYSSILIHVRSIHKVVSREYINFSDYVESDYMKINLEAIDANTFNAIPAVKYENAVFGMTFEAILEPTNWEKGKLVKGLLRLSICSKKDSSKS